MSASGSGTGEAPDLARLETLLHAPRKRTLMDYLAGRFNTPYDERPALYDAAVKALPFLLAEAKRAAVLDRALNHVTDMHADAGGFCREDGFTFPCPTRRAVTEAQAVWDNTGATDGVG